MLLALLMALPCAGISQSLSLQAGPVVSFNRFSNRPLIRYSAGLVFDAPLSDKWELVVAAEYGAKGSKIAGEGLTIWVPPYAKSRLVFHGVSLRSGAAFFLPEGFKLSTGLSLSFLTLAGISSVGCKELPECRLPFWHQSNFTFAYRRFEMGAWLSLEKEIGKRLSAGAMLEMGLTSVHYSFQMPKRAARVFIKWRIIK